MSRSKVHPSITAINPKELREVQKIHELGQKYWPKIDIRRFEAEESKTDVQLGRYYFRHPWARICVSYLVVFCNFLIFAEDPVSHSYTECTINYIGDVYSLMFIRWPKGSFILVKLGTWLFAVGLGLLVGKYLIHKYLFCYKFKLKIFTEDGQGSWMVMFLSCFFFLYIFTFVYNGFLMLEGKYMDKLHARPQMDIESQTFMKMCAFSVWLGDFITAWMVTDMMLQGLKYPDWAKGLRNFWKKGLNRVYAFWALAVIMTIVVATAIGTDYLNWDKISRDFMPTNELSRSFLSSFIIVMDLLIVMQDWEFPHFAGALDIKLPGLNDDSIEFQLPNCFGKTPIDIYITGKWFNYGLIFLVMILDLNMWKNQIFYDPFTYGQYTDAEGYIYTISDKQFLRWANDSIRTYDWRWSHINPKTNRTYGSDDIKMNSKYKGYSLGLKGLAFVPSLLCFCLFGYLLWLFSKEENGDEALIRRYRCDVRRERQRKRVRRKRRRAERLKRKSENSDNMQNTTVVNLAVNQSDRQKEKTDMLDAAFFLDDAEEEEQKEDENTAEAQPIKPKKDFKYYLRHPYFRLFTSYFVVFCNFLIFAEDPVSHSCSDCIVDIIGNIYSFIGARYPPHLGYCVLKVFMFVLSVITGIIVGKFFFHRWLFCRVWKIKIFSEDGQGSWMVMLMTTMLFAWVWGFCYNEFLVLGNPEYIPYKVSKNMGIKNETFMKVAAMCTWFGDFITAWMVTDMMLQEDDYEWWCRRLRRWWTRGRNRVYAFWFVSFSMSGVVFTTLTTGFLDWDRISDHFMPTNEVSRAFLASFILVMDLMIVMQDWEFPSFAGGTNIKLPGVNTGDVRFNLPGGEVNISGKWFNYGIIFIVMILDLNMWKNQIFYEPFAYGQYTDSEDHIYTVCNRTWLRNATREMLTYEWRWNNTNPWTNETYGLEDQRTNSKYIGYPLSVKGIAFGPSIAAFVLFGFLAKKFSKDDEEERNRQKKPFVAVQEEDEDDWYVEDEVDAKEGYNRTHRRSEDQRLADQLDMDEAGMELKPFRRAGRDHSITDDKREQIENVPEGSDEDNDDDGKLSIAQIARFKVYGRAMTQKRKITETIAANSLISLNDSENGFGTPTKQISKSKTSLTSGQQGSKASLSSSDHPHAARNDANSMGSNDSGEESDAPKELSFANLQTDEERRPSRGKENWEKLRDKTAMSFGDLFRASNAEGSQSSLQSVQNEDEGDPPRGRGLSTTNLLQVPDVRGKSHKR